jgi:hypothetical protein
MFSLTHTRQHAVLPTVGKNELFLIFFTGHASGSRTHQTVVCLLALESVNIHEKQLIGKPLDKPIFLKNIFPPISETFDNVTIFPRKLFRFVNYPPALCVKLLM